jgi:uridine nucleosidase
VFPGASKALVRPQLHAPTDIHGESGLDGTDLLPRPLTPANMSIPAIDAMAEALKREKPDTAWVVATGSMTNVASLFKKYPELVNHIKGLSIMGGAVGGGFTDAVSGQVNGVERIGNWTQFAEFNIVVDPEAAASLFENKPLAQKMTMIPLDVTHLVLATKQVQELLLYGDKGGTKVGKGKSKLRIMLVELLNFFAETYA